MDLFFSLAFAAIILVFGAVLRLAAGGAASRIVGQLGKRLETEWSDEADATLMRHFRGQFRALGVGLMILAVPMAVVGALSAVILPPLSAPTAIAAIFVTGFIAVPAVTYARQARARGVSLDPSARPQDVLSPFVLGVWVAGLALCVITLAACILTLARGAAAPMATWQVGYLAIAFVASAAAAMRIRFLPRRVAALEYVCRLHEVQSLGGVALLLPLLGLVNGFSFLSSGAEVAPPVDPAIAVGIGFAYAALALAASFVVEYRPYRVPADLQLLSDNPPVPV